MKTDFLNVYGSAGFDIMTNEELIEQIAAGGDRQQLMGALWQQNLGLIHRLVKRYAGLSEYDDLMQTAYIGLDKAVRHYEAAAGVAFNTVAGFWIKQALQRYLANCGSTVRLPVYLQQRIYAYKQEKAVLSAALGREPDSVMLCRRLSLTPEQLKIVQVAARGSTSLDKPIAQEDGEAARLGDILPDSNDSYAALHDRLFNEQLARDLWGAVDALPGKQPEIIRARYQNGLTVEAAGQQSGISKTEARREERRALDALGRGKNRRKLSPFYEQIRSAAMRGCGVERFNTTWTSSTEREALRQWERFPV